MSEDEDTSNLHAHKAQIFLDQPLFFYLHEEKSHNEARTLAVANLTVMQGVCLHHIEQAFLSQSIFLLEEVVFRVRACYVPSDHLLTC